MTLLGRKVDAIARSLLANDTTERNYALSELRVLMQHKPKKYEDAEEAVQDALLELGVPDKLSGYLRLVTALSMVVRDPDKLCGLQKGLYVEVAKIHATTASRVERAMRHAIEVSWGRMDMDVMRVYFGSTVSPLKGKPTNGEFLARVANVVRKRMGA